MGAHGGSRPWVKQHSGYKEGEAWLWGWVIGFGILPKSKMLKDITFVEEKIMLGERDDYWRANVLSELEDYQRENILKEHDNYHIEKM